MKTYFPLLLLFLSYTLNAQDAFKLKIDSMNKILSMTKEDTARVNIMLDIAYEYTYVDLSKADSITDKAYNYSLKTKFKNGLAKSLYLKGLIIETGGKVDSSIYLYNKALDIVTETGLTSEKVSILNALGMAYYKMGLFEKALYYYLNAEKYALTVETKLNIGSLYNNIANVFFQQKKYDKALEYHFKGLEKNLKTDNLSAIASSYYNIGLIYKNINNYPKALEYFGKSLDVSEQSKNIFGIAINNQTIADIYIDKGDFKKALEYLNKSEEYRKIMNDQQGLARVYFYKMRCYTGINDYTKGYELGLMSLDISKKLGLRTLRRDILYHLANTSKKMGNYKQAFDFLFECKLLDDSLSDENNQKIFEEMQTKFDTEKKQQQIEIQKAELKNKNLELKQQKIIIWSIVVGLILTIVLLLFVYRSFLFKKKANAELLKQKLIIEKQNKDLQQQNEEISRQRDEITTQRDEIATQRDLVIKQKEQIEHQKKEITDSITYAKRIQEAVLPMSESARSILGEHFILFKPKDIVSGDFYWTTQINEWLIVTVADCTGHGVPGAFMSMLGISFLTEIVRKKEITTANEALNELRKEIINALQQKGVSGEQKDGMDIALVAINKTTMQCQFAGANNPLYLVRKLKNEPSSSHLLINSSSYQLIEYKGDKMPVAIHERMYNFTNHEIQLEQDDLLYLFSDGYADQFGGEHNKKFMYKRFKELILANADKPMNEQKHILEETITQWIGNSEQTDDITVLGMKM